MDACKINSAWCRLLAVQPVSCPSTSPLGQGLPEALSELYNKLIEPASSEPSAWAQGGTDVLTCQRQLTLNTTLSAHAPKFSSQLSIIRLNYVEVEEGAHGPQRVMGNYFRQIYTGSHAKLWTTVFDPCRQGKQQTFSSALGQLRWEGGLVGWREKREGGQLVV